MSQPTTARCPRCGASVPAGAAEPLCPACLLSAALTTRVDRASADQSATAGVTSGPRPASSERAEYSGVFGGYRLLGLLGRGGMGTVYEAEQLDTGRRVALKVLGQELDSPEMRQRFLREGRLAAGVSHPNSLYVFGSEEIEGVPVITMEIAGSGTLKDRLARRGPLRSAEAVDAILDVIAGLEAAFAAGVLHRDIKPSNCFVSPDGSVKIGDFGLSVSALARDDSYVTATGVILGTPAYASPEQLRGDNLDVRADIYSVGATLYTLLTGRAPFEGDNAVQVVANAVNQPPKPLTELRPDAPPGLGRVVARCLAKEPGGRYPGYRALRDVLLPFSSRVPEPASLNVRLAAGWIDYLIAFLVPYVTLMLVVGAEEFHLQPLFERSLHSARYHLAVLGFGFLYFAIFEGIRGAGLGKWLKGLRVVGVNGRTTGFGPALIRVALTVLPVECVRIPFLLATISASNLNEITGTHIWLLVGATNVCAWIPVLLTLSARRENGHATIWDLVTRTRVVILPIGPARPSMAAAAPPPVPSESARSLGPYQVLDELIPGRWILGTDPVLRRQVWLLRRNPAGLSPGRRSIARPGRIRWLQKVETPEMILDAFEATPGVPFTSLVQAGERIPWSTLRHWLHDLASELWEANSDGTLPSSLSPDRVWITAQGRAILLDDPWPGAASSGESIPARDFAGQQRFLHAIANAVDATGLPLHARSVLRNLEGGRFEKLSFLTGTLRGLLDKPAEVSKGIRAGSMFMLPAYVWILVLVGYYPGNPADPWHGSVAGIATICALLVLGAAALIQFLLIPWTSPASHHIFRLAVVDARGGTAGLTRLLVRWAVVWLPLFLPIALAALWLPSGPVPVASGFGLAWLLLWIGAAASAVVHPTRGLHDRLAGTWLVRR